MKTISNEVAKILSVEVWSKIDKHFEAKYNALTNKAKASKSYDDLKSLHDAKRKAYNAYQIAEKKFQRRFGVSISSYSGKISLSTKKKYSPSTNELKTQIIIANQINGIDPSKVVDYVVKKNIK